jgi:hypothetical protein
MEGYSQPRSRAEIDQRVRDARRNEEEVLRRLAALATVSKAADALPIRLAFPRRDADRTDVVTLPVQRH